MKYIRTKDGIRKYGYNDGIIFATPEEMDYLQKEYKNYIEKSECKIANSIEDLCDEFVYVDEKIKQFLVSDDIDKYKAKQYKVFGAIWTDKGLIYVAKMNEKGELELL